MRTSIKLANDGPITSTESIHISLPEMLYLLGGSAINQLFFDDIDKDWIRGSAILEGQSKREPQEDDLDAGPTGPTEYIRPNGEIYYARNWTGQQDVEVLKLGRTHMQFPLLYGPPGTGKTALCEGAFGTELITVVLSGDTAVIDLVGQFIPNPLFGLKDTQPEYSWVDGPLIVAAENGLPLLLDEVGLADPKVLAVAYGLMDGRRELVVTSNPDRGTVKAKDGFYIIGSTNPKAPGVQLSEALLSRFTIHAEVTTDWGLAVSKLEVPELIAGIASSLSKRQAKGEIDWSPQMRELLAFRDLCKIFGEPFAVANLIATAPEDDREQVAAALERAYPGIAFAARI